MYKHPDARPLMAIGGVITWVVRSGLQDVQIPRHRTGTAPHSAACHGHYLRFALAVLVMIGLVPYRVCIISNGVAEPADKEIIHAEQGGFVQSIKAQDGQWLNKGDTILICQDPELDRQIAGRSAADLDQWKANRPPPPSPMPPTRPSSPRRGRLPEKAG